MTNAEILQKVIDENIEKYVAGRLRSLGVIAWHMFVSQEEISEFQIE